MAINILLSWDFSISKALKEAEKYLANHIERTEGFYLFYQVICLLEISVLSSFVQKSELWYTVRYTHTDNAWTSGIHKGRKKLYWFSTRQTNSLSARRELVLCTSSILFSSCRLHLGFCVALTCSSAVVRKNKINTKEELLNDQVHQNTGLIACSVCM